MSCKFDYLGDVEVFLVVVEYGLFIVGVVVLFIMFLVLSCVVICLEVWLGW